MDIIRDGRGRGYQAAVNAKHQLATRATSVEQRLKSTADGLYWEATTGSTTLTNATETGLIYLYNNDADDNKVIVIDRVFYDIWATTGGSGGGTLKYYKNPTVTGGTSIDPTNTNFNLSNTPTGTFKKSLTTMTGTVWWTAYFDASSSTALEEGRIILPKGRSFGISITAPTGNTSMAISLNVAFYLLDTSLLD